MIKVNNLKTQSGNPAPNQFIIEKEGKTTFQSYQSMILEVDHDNHILKLGKNWQYSRTTSKYLNIFLKELDFNINNKDLQGKNSITINNITYNIIREVD